MKTAKLSAIMAAILILGSASLPVSARESSEGPRGRDSDDDLISTTTISDDNELRGDGSVDDNQETRRNRGLNSTSSINSTTSPRSATATAKQDDKDGKRRSEEHRSTVASFVQNLIELSDRDDGIGAEVREIAREQNESKDKVASATEQIENRSKIKSFFVGTDYKNLGEIRSEIAGTVNRIERLTKILERASTSTMMTSTIAELNSLKEEQVKLSRFVSQNENKFSLLGWFAKLFGK